MSSHEKIAEEKIRDAMDAGQFDGLPGAGKPLDLGGYFATPSGWRMGLSILRSAGMVPEEIDMLREVNRLGARLKAERIPAERRAIRRRIAELTAHYEIRMARYRKGTG